MKVLKRSAAKSHVRKPPRRHTRLLSIPVDSCRFGLRGARRGPDATSRRVYERGRMYEGLATGSLSRRWDYTSERSAVKSHIRIERGQSSRSFQSRVDRNRQESTGIELQRVALRTRFARLWEVADWSFAPHRHARLPSIPVDSRRFGSSRARRGLLFAGHGVTGPRCGASRRWDRAGTVLEIV